MNILLLYGGVSSEHEVSCLSAVFLEKSLKQAGYNVLPVFIDLEAQWHLQQGVARASSNKKNPCSLRGNVLTGSEVEHRVDFAFSIIHGTNGEDGTIQGLFEFFNLPYAGCGVLSSSISMDKKFMRQAFSAAGLDQVEYLVFDKRQVEKDSAGVQNKIQNTLGDAVFTKPCGMGSSVGVSRVQPGDDLQAALNEALKYDHKVMIEKAYSVREIEISILGNYPDYQVSAIGEIIPKHDFYSYEAKYIDSEGAELQLPAQLDSALVKKVEQAACQAFAAIEGDGFARVDFFIDKQSNRVLINEINTLPGMTEISMFPKLFALKGKNAETLVKEIVDLGLQRNQLRHELVRTSGFSQL